MKEAIDTINRAPVALIEQEAPDLATGSQYSEPLLSEALAINAARDEDVKNTKIAQYDEARAMDDEHTRNAARTVARAQVVEAHTAADEALAPNSSIDKAANQNTDNSNKAAPEADKNIVVAENKAVLQPNGGEVHSAKYSGKHRGERRTVSAVIRQSLGKVGKLGRKIFDRSPQDTAKSDEQAPESRRAKAVAAVRKPLTRVGKTAGRITDAPFKAGGVLQTKAATFREYLGDEEHGNDRKAVTAFVVGSLALVGTGFLAAKGFDMSSHTGSEAAAGLAGKAGRAHDSIVFTELAPKGTAHGVQVHESLLDSVKIGEGDRPWNVLHDAGITDPMGALDRAAKESGLDYGWHGRGTHRYLEVAGKTDTASVLASLNKFIKN